MKPIHYLHLIIAISVFFALSCARQTAPTGGPKDSIPPTLIQSLPADQQTNFSGKDIQVTFSEFILLNNPKDQIIISPGVGKDFTAIANKYKVDIKLNNDLQPNTTYTVNFREAVQDITEKNPAKNLHLAFSTGTYIDSLHIFGTVYELLTATEAKNATVGLYESDTFNIFKHKPVYFTQTDEHGTFHIDNLKPGSYHAYAWSDNNKNLIVDSKSEGYAFVPQLVQPQDTTYALDLPIIRLDARPLKITSARPSQTFFNIKTSKSTAAFTITSSSERIYASYGDDTENIRIYNTLGLQADDSVAVEFHSHDSLTQQIDTTLYVKFSQREIKPNPFQLTPEASSLSGLTGLLNTRLLFNKPVFTVNTDSLFYRIDTTQVIPISANDIQFDTTRTIATITKQINKTILQPQPQPQRSGQQALTKTAPPTSNKQAKQAPKPYQLVISKGTFISVESDTSKAAELSIKPTTLETTGVIILNITTRESPLIAQLIAKGKVIASKPASKTTTFSDLEPGEYSVRVVVDKDGNKAWSPGNVIKNLPPEPIHFYRAEDGKLTISLKANWERELLITF